MCGRFSLFAPLTVVTDRFDATFVEAYVPSYNVAPSQERPVVPDVAADTFRAAKWGLVPPWADGRDDGEHVNARAETAGEKPSFRDAFAGNDAAERGAGDAWERESAGRCLVPADGFYEWGDRGDGRRPYRVEVGDGDPFAMAGLWTRWTPPQRQAGIGEFGDERTAETAAVHSFAILTTGANDAIAPIHDRMPVILAPDEERVWLESDSERARTVLDPYDGPLGVFPVSDAVNDPRNDSPAVVEPVEG